MIALPRDMRIPLNKFFRPNQSALPLLRAHPAARRAAGQHAARLHRQANLLRVDRAAKADAAGIAARHAEYEHEASVLPMLQRAGVTIMAGTDAGFLNSFNYPGIALHQELGIFVDNGIVVVEDYQRRIAEGESRLPAAIAAGETMLKPLLVSSLAIIFAFAPLPCR